MQDRPVDPSPSRPRRRDLLIGGGVAAAAAGVAAVGLAPPASATGTESLPVFTPVTPSRYFDSRDGAGPIGSGEHGTITPSSPFPPDLVAILFNLTVTGTTTTGFLSIFPDDVSWPGTSNINWFGPNQILANNVFTGFGSDGGIVVLCGGGGSTDFVLDVVGMSVTTDVVTPASISAAADPELPDGRGLDAPRLLADPALPPGRGRHRAEAD